MLIIQGKEIKIDTMNFNTGVFTGQNFIPTWNAHFKSNINVTSISMKNDLNGTTQSINIINDSDGFDFTGTTSDFVVGQGFDEEIESQP